MTPESAPLSVFGEEVSRLVRVLLLERGVRFLGEARPRLVDRDGALVLASGERVEADRVVAATELRGPRISGLPVDRWGFVATDAHGGVIGLQDVYAAGDMTSFPIKQGGLAAQQADVIAERIAAKYSTAMSHQRVQRVLRARLVGGSNPVYLRQIGARRVSAKRPRRASTGAPRYDEPAVAPEKVFGRYLSPYLQTRSIAPVRTAARWTG